jgi:hypothetical protein
MQITTRGRGLSFRGRAKNQWPIGACHNIFTAYTGYPQNQFVVLAINVS